MRERLAGDDNYSSDGSMVVPLRGERPDGERGPLDDVAILRGEVPSPTPPGGPTRRLAFLIGEGERFCEDERVLDASNICTVIFSKHNKCPK